MDLHRLRLYVVGTTPASSRAIVNTRRFCEEHLGGAYNLDVVDLSLDPAAATIANVIAAPTLVKESPPPVRRFVGDMSDTARLMAGFGLELSREDR
ncbi:circadian clock KaiB family protein [Ideonella sp. YS5]|uniref:circadian clock KaiB family protein n=1 Tax=Ideonella sp. YS5 TaxID=3453714 RepID=UPI003EEC1ECE